MRRDRSGFTLIEVLVATSIMTVFMASTFYILLSCFKIYNKVSISIQKLENGWMIMDRIRFDARASAGVDAQSTSSYLKLLSGISYDCIGRKIRRIEGGYAGYLSTGIVDQLSFSYPDTKTVITTLCLGKNLVITGEGSSSQ